MNDPNLDDNVDSTNVDSTDEANLADASTIKPRQNSRTSDIYERFLNRVKHIESRGETDVSDADKIGLSKAKKQPSAFAILRTKKRSPSDNEELNTSEDAGLNPDFDWNFNFEDDSDDNATDHNPNNHNAEDEHDKTADAAKSLASIDGYSLENPDVASPYDSLDIDMQLADATTTTFDDELPADNQYVQDVQTDETDAVAVEAEFNSVAKPVVSAPSERASSKKRLMIGGVIGTLLGVVILLALTTTGVLFNSSSDTGNNVTGSDTKDTGVNKNSDTALTDTKPPASEVSNAPAMIAEASAIMNANTDISTNLNDIANDMVTNKEKTDENAVPINKKQANTEPAPAKQTKSAEIAFTASAEQTANDEPNISYDDFAQEAKRTLYRDIDD